MASVSKRRWTHKGVTKETWVVRYNDQGGAQRMKTFEKKKDADAYRLKIETERLEGIMGTTGRKLSVAQVCREFLEARHLRVQEGKIGQGRYENLERMIRLYVIPLLPHDLKIAELNWRHVEAWGVALRACKAKDGAGFSNGQAVFKTRRLIGTATKNSAVDAFKQVEKYAVRRGIMSRRLLADFGPEPTRDSKKAIRTFSAEAIRKLLDVADTRDPHVPHRVQAITRCAVHLAAFCGLRKGEVFGLTVDDLDLVGRLIHVRHSLTDWNVLKRPKTSAGLRDVPIPAHMVEMIENWMTRHYQPNERRLVFSVVPKDGSTPKSGHLSATFQNGCWYPLLRRAGMWTAGERDHMHFHALRHFASSWMVENGLSLPDTASLMGHLKWDMTLQTYVHPIVGGSRRHDVMDKAASLLPAGTAQGHDNGAIA